MDNTPGEVNAFAACENGRSLMAITDGLLEVAAWLPRRPHWRIRPSAANQIGTAILRTLARGESPRSDRIRKLVVESGSARLDQWLDYERDIRADFERVFGEPPGALVGVAIMTDINLYLDFALKLFLVFGVTFEIPVAVLTPRPDGRYLWTFTLIGLYVVSADSAGGPTNMAERESGYGSEHGLSPDDPAYGMEPPHDTAMVVDDFGDVYGVFLAITGDGYSQQELRRYAEFLRRELLLEPGKPLGLHDIIESRRRLGASARATYEAHFSLPHVITALRAARSEAA